MGASTCDMTHRFRNCCTQVLKSKGVLTGVKTDKGLVPIPGSPRETTTRGMDTLLERSKGYYRQGARFAKW